MNKPHSVISLVKCLPVCTATIALCLFTQGAAGADAHEPVASIAATTNNGSVLPGGWHLEAKMPFRRGFAAAAASGGIVYVAGGIRVDPTNTLYAYNIASGSWTELAHMPGDRYDGDGAAVIDGFLYLPGGWTRYPPLPHSSLYVYNMASNTWKRRASLPRLSGCGATGATGGKLYVLTACDGYSGYSHEFDVYDPATNTWAELPPPFHAHGNPAFGIVARELIVAGGLDSDGRLQGTTEAYNPATNSWTMLAPEPHPVQIAASVATNGRLFVIGGNDASGQVATVQIYDSRTNSWSAGTPLPYALSAATAAVEEKAVFVDGGGNSTKGFKSNIECVARVCGGY